MFHYREAKCGEAKTRIHPFPSLSSSLWMRLVIDLQSTIREEKHDISREASSIEKASLWCKTNICFWIIMIIVFIPTLNLFLENCLWSTDDLVLLDPPPSDEEPASKWWLRSSLPCESFRILGSHFLEKKAAFSFPVSQRQKKKKGRTKCDL